MSAEMRQRRLHQIPNYEGERSGVAGLHGRHPLLGQPGAAPLALRRRRRTGDPILPEGLFGERLTWRCECIPLSCCRCHALRPLRR
jgi:hypothetical protein